MKPKLYLETSVLSYLTARPSRDLIVAANQQITQDWWQSRRAGFDLYVSQLVVQEVSAGDATAAQQRLTTNYLYPTRAIGGVGNVARPYCC